MQIARPPTLGVLLAGGLSRRMGGGDKAMHTIGGRTILHRVIERVRPQCDALILNANGDPSRFAAFGLPVVADSIADFPGPLAGILTALDWCSVNRPDISWVLSVPTDCPFLPTDLVTRLHAVRTKQNAEIATAASGGQMHHVIALWPVALRDDLRRALVGEGVRRISEWAARFARTMAEWPDAPIDPFFNTNTADDLAEAERLAEDKAD